MCIQVPQRSATSDAQLSTKSKPEQDTSTASDGTDLSEQVPESSRTESDQSEAVQQPIIFRTPAQEKLQNEISALNAELHAMECRTKVGNRSKEDKEQYKNEKMKIEKKNEGKSI